MTTASRFRPDMRQRTDSLRCQGLCRDCLREMWTGGDARHGLVRAPRDGAERCEGCTNWRRNNPGQDPRRAKGTIAERIPAELPESDPSWRDEHTPCREVPAELFNPEPDKSDPEYIDVGETERSIMAELRAMTAQTVCSACPVRRQCREAAFELGAEGLWGGVFFTRNKWTDLITRETGPTIHAVNKKSAQAAETAA